MKIIIWTSKHPISDANIVNVLRPIAIADMPNALDLALQRAIHGLPEEADPYFVIDESELPEYDEATRDKWYIKNGKVLVAK